MLVLIACGSFSPVTVLHLRIFEEAKNFLKEDFDVRLGIFSVVHDEYKKWKPTLIEAE